ncbi:hypothetical protein EG68_02584 [Paragonimus skrjabini miyazakii]|uniref:Tetraspanin n=1 Tax=Paragonimus skrjabini miyazakii TaxID=59628 RepID=A0A8S9YXK7_9TREM|nr:hypothetical protein EG68_02584 [Paragonimus skrjabini miyazakii]
MVVQLTFGYKVVRCALILFNAIVMASGTILIVMGSYIYNQLTLYSYKNDMQLNELIITVIVVGCAFLLLGFLGFCGACCKRVVKLYVYVVLLVILMICELVCGICGGVFQAEIELWVAASLHKYVNNYYNNDVEKRIMNELQNHLGCCGADGPDDYIWYPTSCYLRKENTTLYTQGCIKRLGDEFRKNLVVVLVLAILFAVSQFMAVISACLLAHKLKVPELA